MIGEERKRVSAELAWLKARSDQIARAEGALERAFEALAGSKK